MAPHGILRRCAERLSRGVVIKRRFSSRFHGVPIYVTPESGLRYWLRSLERVDPFLLDAAEELVEPGAVVWDVGANSGLFAFAAAVRAGPGGRVLALEPDLLLASLLRRSAQEPAAHRAPVEVLPLAADAAPGLVEFHIASRSRAANYVTGGGSPQAGESRESYLAPAVSLDWLAGHYPAPQVLKIDVENLELRVLQGALQLLASARPVVLCEVCGPDSSEVTALFHRRNYTLYNAELKPSHRLPLEATVGNTLARPNAGQS